MHFVGKRIPTKYVLGDLSRYHHFTVALRLVINFFQRQIVSAALTEFNKQRVTIRASLVIIFYRRSSKIFFIFKFETFPLHGNKNKLECLGTISVRRTFVGKN